MGKPLKKRCPECRKLRRFRDRVWKFIAGRLICHECSLNSKELDWKYLFDENDGI